MNSKNQSAEPLVTKEHAERLVRITLKIIRDTFTITAAHQGTIFDGKPFPMADISGFVSIMQETMIGTLAFFFPQATLTGLLGQVYRTPPANLEKSSAAAVGEICNMVFSAFKTELNDSGQGYAIKMALPNVVVGPKHQVLNFLPGHCFVATFKSDFGVFQMGVTSPNESTRMADGV